MADNYGLLFKLPTFLSIGEDDLSVNYKPNKLQWYVVNVDERVQAWNMRFMPKREFTPHSKHLFEIDVTYRTEVPVEPSIKMVVCTVNALDEVFCL